MPEITDLIGVVAIGRNEGDRLSACLASLTRAVRHVVYVDSGSTDDSLQRAQAAHAHIVQLDTSRPFTAARARNAGLARLLQIAPDLAFIQFIDGDCQVAAGWFPAALQWLQQDPRRAVVCGRRRERFPARSLYNRLCDMEWNTPVGEVRACGGDALMRVEALQQVRGYDESLIAGEEPELCVRLRQQGWTVWRIAAEMTLHDAQMLHLGQWWRRMKRAGHAYAEGAALHGAPPERHFLRETCSIWCWGLAWPLILLVILPWSSGVSLLGLLAYPLGIARVAFHRRRHWGDAWRDCWLYGLSCVLGKFPQAVGQLNYGWRRVRGQPSLLIEYKGPASGRWNAP